MRSLILVLGTIALLVGACFAYLWFQPDVATVRPKRTVSDERPERPDASATIARVGTVEEAWIVRIDPQTGEIASRFRGKKYEPQPDNTVLVDQPQAEFYSARREQLVRIDALRGRVVLGGAIEQSEGEFARRMDMPNRGKLEDVTISMFEPSDAPEPVLVVRLANAVFDNDAFSISTESFVDDQGNRVEGDEVPVVVRGRDYDFDGRGLLIRWNERDRKLQLLEIAHGESLTIKNSRVFPDREVAYRMEPVMLASVDPRAHAIALAAAESSKRRAKAPAPAPRPAIQRDRSPTVYRAIFDRNVTVHEDDELVASGAQMHVEFLHVPHDPATKEERDERALTLAPAEEDRAGGAIVVRWTGKLRVAPLEESSQAELVEGKPAVRLLGAPVVLRRDGNEITCASAFYNSADSSADLRGDDAIRQVSFTDARGAKVVTQSMRLLDEDGQRVAILTGPSTARIPAPGEADQDEELICKWTERCRLLLVEDESGRTSITEIHLSGKVEVDHPRLALKSDALELALEPTSKSLSSELELRRVVATGNVHTVIRDADRGEQIIDARRLVVETARAEDGNLYAKSIDADGDVIARGDDQELRAQTLGAKIRAADKPAPAEQVSFFGSGQMQLESLHAKRDVVLVGRDGTHARADELRVETIEGMQEARLIGKPAQVTRAENSVSGQVIRLVPDEKIAEVVGAGTMTAVSETSEGEVVQITWTGGARIVGQQNMVYIDDNVKMRSTMADGTVNRASSKSLEAQLAAREESAETSQSPSGFMSDSQLVAATLIGDVEVSSELSDEQGELLRGFNLFAERVNYDRVAGKMTVPVAGRMLYRDHRPPVNTRDEGPTLGSGRGATAFGWRDSLVYDDQRKQAVMEGEVAIVHRPQDKDSQPVRIDASRVTAWFDAEVEGSAEPDSEKLRLRHVVAEREVRVNSNRTTFTADELEYDALQRLLTARGTPDQPGMIIDSTDGSTGAFEELQWNTETDHFRIIKAAGRVVR